MWGIVCAAVLLASRVARASQRSSREGCVATLPAYSRHNRLAVQRGSASRLAVTQYRHSTMTDLQKEKGIAVMISRFIYINRLSP